MVWRGRFLCLIFRMQGKIILRNNFMFSPLETPLLRKRFYLFIM
ncbi:hypothetical protein HMPREF0083_05900 [Aneurinibacillus aneurinilyticus ATCC 12856]|uniref:Uncharacterized protein n=1 Tax=Aneurinibacillus aneurinilyticus ATCC 12856 TaxID=649747 RepID=U1Y1S5_ANEAE|nr:hypothetical protein HMPREF0083_05900 [Aneurinibacillus aneurinilyticus ATCC 12856]